MERLAYQLHRAEVQHARLGETLHLLRTELEKMAKEETAPSTPPPSQQGESWDDDDYPSFSLPHDGTKKRKPTEFCAACRGKHCGGCH